MGRLIEQQAVIDCLTSTAEYYDMPQADEWTKGIHYGLLHGVDNILDNVPPVEAIPKADYENRLKADLKAILTELQLEIEESENCGKAFHLGLQMASNVIQQKINELKQESTTKTDKVDCKHTDCNNCVNHKCCDYEPTTKNDLGVDCIVDVLGSYTDLDIPYKREIAENILTKLPSVTPIRPKGHWTEEFNDLEDEVRFTCSSCGKYQLFGTDFCYHCGAKMVEPQESED